MRTWLPVALMLGASGVAAAAEGALDSARRCAGLQDSLERLVCYDRLFGVAGSAPATALSPAPAPAPATANAPAAPSAPAAAPASSGAASTQAGTGFGGEMVKRSIGERESSAGPRTLNATVASLRETRPDVYVITLDNGQIWQQMDKDGVFYLKVGDTVQIDRGAMGGYRMARTSQGRSGWVRVNRLK